MARIDWVKQRLDNWALWKEREARGGMGFYRTTSFLRLAVDRSHHDALLSSVDDVEAQETDRAVSSLLAGHPQVHRTIVLIYVEDKGIRTTALMLGRAESTVKANLERGDHLLAAWRRERADEKEQRRKSAGSFTP